MGTPRNRTIAKPKGYVKHWIVYDKYPILIVCLDYTMFQSQITLGKDYEEFEVVEDGDNLIITLVD